MGGIALGAAAYHAIQIYLAETDAQDPVKAEPAPADAPAEAAVDESAETESAADAPAEAAAESAAADGMAEKEPAPESVAVDAPQTPEE